MRSGTQHRGVEGSICPVNRRNSILYPSITRKNLRNLWTFKNAKQSHFKTEEKPPTDFIVRTKDYRLWTAQLKNKPIYKNENSVNSVKNDYNARMIYDAVPINSVLRQEYDSNVNRD